MDELAAFVTRELDLGNSKEQIANDLVLKGVEFKAAQRLVQSLQASMDFYKDSEHGRRALAEQYRRKMRTGLVWAGGGTVVTVGSYILADGGGRFFIAWGAVIWGVIDIVRGFLGWRRYRKANVATAVCPYCSRPVEVKEKEVATRLFICPACNRAVQFDPYRY